MLNTVLHHVGMSWIIETDKHLEYDMEKNNSDCITGGPWQNKFIYKKIYVKVFEKFIRNARTDKYNLMCFIDAQKKKNPPEHDYENSGGGYTIQLNSTT